MRPLTIIFAVAGVASVVWLLWPRRKPSPARHRMQRDSRTWMPAWAKERFENAN